MSSTCRLKIPTISKEERLANFIHSLGWEHLDEIRDAQ